MLGNLSSESDSTESEETGWPNGEGSTPHVGGEDDDDEEEESALGLVEVELTSTKRRV